MQNLEQRFAALGVEFAPGQERQVGEGGLSALHRGPDLPGTPVDFSHGDVDAFLPPPNALQSFQDGVAEGGSQAYTPYRGKPEIRTALAEKLTAFTGASIDPEQELIITPGTQGALFLAMAACVGAEDKVAIVEPDYFANRKLVKFFGGTLQPVRLHFEYNEPAVLDLTELEQAFHNGTTVFVFSNPNNPTGVVYTADQIAQIAELAERYNVTVIADQLYSRLLYPGVDYTHMQAAGLRAQECVTIMGPSKTESLSGYRLGVAFGAAEIIARMEQAQAIVSLRAAGYNQAVLNAWFAEPEGWLTERIAQHAAIREDLVEVFNRAGLWTRLPEAGSYLFPRLPKLEIATTDLVALARQQAGVTVTAGQEFSPHHADHIRLNFSQDHEAAVAAAHRLVEMVNRYTV